MKDTLTDLRNRFLHFFYVHFYKRIFFCFDPENVHAACSRFGMLLGTNNLTRRISSFLFNYSNPALEQKIHGILFKNPIGLSAGFDKDGYLTKILPSVGFGFEEIGSITAEPCSGNPGTRMWRHPEKKSIRVYIGLKSEGAKKVAQRLQKTAFQFPIGISIAKTNSTKTCETKAGIADYAETFKSFLKIGDYFTINISCPNAFGGEPFTDPKKLESLLTELDKIPTQKPILLKLPPDLSEKQIDEILAVTKRHRVHGFVASNLTKQHSHGKGGMSGKFLEKKANALIATLYKKTQGGMLIIGSGGVFSAEDAYEKIRLGASLLELITGMIYEGPQVISEINRGLVQLLKKDGYKNIGEAVGKN